MPHYKFVMDLRPGDVLADDEPEFEYFHNGDPRVTRTRVDRTSERTVYTIWFADGSACETREGALRVRVES